MNINCPNCKLMICSITDYHDYDHVFSCSKKCLNLQYTDGMIHHFNYLEHNFYLDYYIEYETYYIEKGPKIKSFELSTSFFTFKLETFSQDMMAFKIKFDKYAVLQ